jgi:hypothetical protein
MASRSCVRNVNLVNICFPHDLSVKREDAMIHSKKRATNYDWTPVRMRQGQRSDRERLAWLLKFSEYSESQIKILPELTLRRLRSEVWRFPEHAMTQGGDEDLSCAQIGQLASKIGAGLRALIRGEPWMPRIGKAKLYLRLKDGEAQRRYITSHSDGFLLEACELVAAQAKRLRLCERSQCRQLFAANKRQVFCSSRCSQMQRTGRFLANHSREQLSVKRHERYKEQIKKEKGPAVAGKVLRRGVNADKSEKP